ncbi:MAG: hypothetical protein LBK99_16250 [Opitutaceae bacterium]|jgi:hypothetical protein|nr:hypothetical protein [Opitutaceae bacterium]
MILTEHDFDTIKKENLRQFDDNLSKAGPRHLGREVRALEANAVQLYGVAALMARNADDIETVASIWTAMEKVCDAFAKKLGALAKKHPGSKVSHDKLLDLRNRCTELRELHS